MKKLIFGMVSLIVVIMFGLTSTSCRVGDCGDGGDSGVLPGSITEPEPEETLIYGWVQLGNVANATVKIYEVAADGSLQLKWTETTSSGAALEEIGRFNTHASELEDDKLYLYVATGGEDWDADDDGVMDSSGTQNNGTARVLVEGKYVKSAGENFRITALSEVIYEKIAKYMKYSFSYSNIQTKMSASILPVIEDVNGDSKVDILDIITFNPVNNRDKLKGLYQGDYPEIVSTIHDGVYVFERMKFVKVVDNTDTPGDAKDIVLSSDETKAYIADGDAGLHIIDITNPDNPIVGSVDTDGSAEGVILSQDETKAYVADGAAGLKIIDITDPANPSILGSVDTPGNALKVALSQDETRAYVADGSAGLTVIDITNPSSPSHIC